MKRDREMVNMIKRDKFVDRILRAFRVCRCVCILGPKGVGKQTISAIIEKEFTQVSMFDLETLSDVRLLDEPDYSIYKQRGLIVIKAIQRKPEFFSYLRSLHDKQFNQNFLILGDFSDNFIRQTKQSLAGRLAYVEIPTLSLVEVQNLERLWLQGGFPESYLLDQEESLVWRKEYMLSHVEHRLTILGFNFNTDTVRYLWELLAYDHGQILSYVKYAHKLKITNTTVIRYVSYLEESFMLRVLRPWHENIKKRQIRSPKVYYRDSGLLNYVLNIKTYKALLEYPTKALLFEGFAMEEIIKFHSANRYDCYFWASYNGASLDLLITHKGQKLGFIFTLEKEPKITPSMRIAKEDLKLDSITVITLKSKSYKLDEKINVISLEKYLKAKRKI